MQASGFRAKLQQELNARRERNPRYSLRSFAAFLGIDHSSLSQILRARRPIPSTTVRTAAKKLGMDREEIAAYVAAEHVPSPAKAEREDQLRHWTAEAMSIATEPVHWELLRLSRTNDFRADSRWIAQQIGVSVDEVNVALSRMLRLHLLAVSAQGKWMDLTNPPVKTEAEFRSFALAQVRKKQPKGILKNGKPGNGISNDLDRPR
jgi:hypothetical protein